MSRKPIIAANWKMNIGPAEGAQFIESFKNLVKGKDVACDVFSLNEVFEAFDELGAFGGADVHLPVGGNDGFAGHSGMRLIRSTHCCQIGAEVKHRSKGPHTRRPIFPHGEG